MQIMFTCLMPLWSVGGRQSQRGAALSQARPDPLLTPRWAPSSPLGSSARCRVRQAMGLCAGFAMADLKPVCGEKIGLIYHPLFTVHILFVNPTDYILSCYHPSFLSGFPPPAHTHAHKTVKTKVFVNSENQTQQSTLAQSEWAIKWQLQSVHTQTKALLSTQKAMAMEQLEEDHMLQKHETIMLLHPTTKPHLVSLYLIRT